jgi:bacterioferritin
MQPTQKWHTLRVFQAPSAPQEPTMKGDAQVIGHLQAQLKNELTAINQYFLHYRMLKHWGFDKLAKKEYDESIGEMKHADWLMDPHLYSSTACPTCRTWPSCKMGEDVPEILACDLRAEQGAQATIKAGHGALRRRCSDYVSRDLLQAHPERHRRPTSTTWKPRST